jgi:hypothetical protein
MDEVEKVWMARGGKAAAGGRVVRGWGIGVLEGGGRAGGARGGARVGYPPRLWH